MLSVLVDDPVKAVKELEGSYPKLPLGVCVISYRRLVVALKVRPAHVVIHKAGVPVVSVLNPLEVRFSNGKLFKLIESEAVQWAINNGVI